MLRSISLAAVAAAATAADSTDYCLLAQEGHPTVDLRALSLSNQDYSVNCHANEHFQYVLNICADLDYVDETCHQGAAVCQRHRNSELPSEVYGYTGSVDLKWNDPDGSYTWNSTVVMSMTGAPCNAANNASDAKTSIMFQCSNKEFLMLESEDLASCTANFVFFTAQACGAPRYTCFNGTKCVAEKDGISGTFSSFDTCSAACGTVPVKYACTENAEYGFQCVEKPDGPFASFSDCNNDCAKRAKESADNRNAGLLEK